MMRLLQRQVLELVGLEERVVGHENSLATILAANGLVTMILAEGRGKLWSNRVRNCWMRAKLEGGP
jgi:hypothetical protein